MGPGERFKPGDRVIHTRRPEWGLGVVNQARTIIHDGVEAQQLVVTFANYGRVTLNTALAHLSPSPQAMDQTAMKTTHSSQAYGSSAGSDTTKGWLDTLERSRNGEDAFWRLPESLTDPFISIAKRLAATLETFRYGTDAYHARNVLEWAIAQTGLSDPMTRYTRQELEQGFRRFLRLRDQHLVELVRAIKRQGRLDVLEECLRNTPYPQARAALERAMKA